MSETHPLLEEIRRIADDGRTGTLVLAKDTAQIKINFDQGQISSASSDIPRYLLGKFLARAEYLKESSVAELLAEAKKRRRMLGEAAVQKRILDATELADVVQDQAAQILMHALKEDFAIRTFSPGRAPVYLPAKMSFEQLLLKLARQTMVPFRPDPHQALVLRNGHDLSHLGWYPQELSVLSQLKHPRSVQELASATGLEYTRLCKILSVLDALKLVSAIDRVPAETTAVAVRDAVPFEHLVPEIQNPNLSDKLETFHNGTSFISEQFRTLKVRLAEMNSVKPLKLVVVSSPHTGEGKSLITTNLAISFAKDLGRRTLLVDCDLRNPTVHKYLGASLEPGLKGYLETDYLLPYCYMRRLGSLFVMTAGGTATNPIELFMLDKMKDLADYLRREFDTIIMDAPPLAPIADAQVLTKLADGLIVVVRSGKTTYPNLERAFRTLDVGKLVGFVLNDVKPRMFNTQYNYKFYHYKGRSLYPYGGESNPRPRPKSYLE